MVSRNGKDPIPTDRQTFQELSKISLSGVDVIGLIVGQQIARQNYATQRLVVQSLSEHLLNRLS